MATDPTRITELFQRYADKTATPEEIRELFQLAASGGFDGQLNELLLERLGQTEDSVEYEREVWDQVLSRVRDDIDAIENPLPLSVPELKNNKRSLWTRAGIAAAVAAIILGAGLFFYNGSKSDKASGEVYANDIAPGKQGATLTLSSGKKIHLADAGKGELAREAGVVISKSADGQIVYELKSTGDENKINTISTANGETYELRLPDGSHVWLNAASNLTYSAGLVRDGIRSVKLSGEGYFEVAKDAAHPFEVESRGQRVEVLGTHFNINTYDNEPVSKTTLLEGSIRIARGADTKILVPGQQAALTGEKLSLKEVDTDLAVAWKNGKFIFEHQSIQEIMRIVGRWYDVEVIYTGGPVTETFWGSVSRFNNVSAVLKPLEASGNVHFKIQGRTIFVSP